MKHSFAYYSLSFVSLLALGTTVYANNPTFTIDPIDEQTHSISITFDIQSPDFLYDEFIAFSADNPAITLSKWRASQQPQSHYDTTFKETKKMYTQPVTLSLTAHTESAKDLDANILFSYYLHANKKIVQMQMPVSFHMQTLANDAAIAKEAVEESNTPQEVSDIPAYTESHESFSAYLSHLVKNSDSFVVRMLLVMMLGLLLSLTPCIYPMIPITVGILQAQAHKSIGRNFLISLSYTFGIATTFAMLGLFAAYTGQMFGNFMAKPSVILTIVALLIYLAGSMIGLYEMYTPRFLQNSNTSIKGGSFATAFIFGAMSGTVASPCLSPGLLLLLTLVTTLANKFMGFALLFAFGIGLSLPLLIIGTFSNSLNVLPRAGMWMVDIKQFFGFVMLAMCLYFLQNIMPMYAIYALATLLCIGTGLFYLYKARSAYTPTTRLVKNIVGMVCIAASVYIGAITAKSWMTCQESPDGSCLWFYDYAHALETAKQHKKHVLVDVGAPYCSLCKAIDKKVLTPETLEACQEYCVFVKVDAADESHAVHAPLLKKHNVMGAPTLLLIDQENEEEITRWGGELYQKSGKEFTEALKKNVNNRK